MSNVGFRIYTQINRPARELVESFSGIPVANLSDQMGRTACIGTALHPYNHIPLLGTALTVKVPPNDNLMFHKAIDMAEPGDIIVVDGEGSMTHSLCGEIMFTYAMSRGISGFIIDGCIRDVESLRRLDFPVYARGVQPKGPYKNGPGEINVPVSVDGRVIFPGDIVLGDSDGVVVIHRKDAEDLLIKGRGHNASEAAQFEDIKNGRLNRDWVDAALIANGCQFIE